MKILVKTGAIVILLALAWLVVNSTIEANASPRIATWSTHGDWTVRGSTEYGYCLATRAYRTDGDMIQIGLNRSTGWTLYVSTEAPSDIIKGRNLTTQMILNKSFTMRGYSPENGMATFDGLTVEFVYQFARANRLHIPNFGTYDLDGSYKTIESLMECVDAVTGQMA